MPEFCITTIITTTITLFNPKNIYECKMEQNEKIRGPDVKGAIVQLLSLTIMTVPIAGYIIMVTSSWHNCFHDNLCSNLQTYTKYLYPRATK